MKDENGPFHRIEALQQQQEGERGRLALRDQIIGERLPGGDRLGEPNAAVFLSPMPRRAQQIERQAGDDCHEIGTWLLELFHVNLREAKPGFLKDVLRVLGDPEHSIGDREQIRAVFAEERGVVERSLSIHAAVARILSRQPRTADE